MSKKKSTKPNRKRNQPTSEVKREFYRRLLYLGLCMIPILLFASNKDEFRLVPLPFFLIGAYQLLLLIGQSQMIVDEFFPPKTYAEKTTQSFDQLLYYFASVLFFIGVILLIFEIRQFDNTIHGARLFWTAGLVGLGIASVCTVLLKIFRPSVYHESNRRFTVHFGLFLGLFLLTAALTGFINHHFADHAIHCSQYTIARKSTSSGRSTEYYFFITLNNNEEERFSVGSNRYDDFEEGEAIELCTRKGKFGFEFVTDFNKVSK